MLPRPGNSEKKKSKVGGDVTTTTSIRENCYPPGTALASFDQESIFWQLAKLLSCQPGGAEKVQLAAEKTTH
eukprot:459045-Rhodomonas_salina.2